MMILSLLLALALAVVAFCYPPLMACVFILCSASDTAGVGGALGISPMTYALGPLCFLSALVAYGKILRERKTDLASRRIAGIAGLALFGCFWITLAAYAATGSVRTVFFSLFNSGMYGMIIALAYRRSRPAQLLFVGLLIVQMLLCMLVTIFNGTWLKIFDAARYISALEGVDYTAGFGISGENIYRISGQFANPVQLAFYGTIGAIVGGWLLAERRLFAQIVGGITLALAGWVLFYTIERAILLGLVVAVLILLARTPITPRMKLIWAGRCAAAAIVVFGVLYLLPPQVLHLPTTAQTIISFFAQLGTSSEYAYRVDAFSGSVDLVASHPLFGMGTFDNLFTELGAMPHQAMLAWSAISGLPAGLCCTLLLWYGLAATFSPRLRLRQNRGNHFTGLSLMFGWVIFAMAISNDMSAGMFGWVCLGIAAQAWVDIPAAVAATPVWPAPPTVIPRASVLP